MKKTKLDAVKLQLKKDKVATLSATQMTDINGGTLLGTVGSSGGNICSTTVIIVWPAAWTTSVSVPTKRPVGFTEWACA